MSDAQRKVVSVGWGAHSEPMLRYEDELHLPEHQRAVAPAPDPLYCECEAPLIDVEHDAGCRRCGRPVDFAPAVPNDLRADLAAGYDPAAGSRILARRRAEQEGS